MIRAQAPQAEMFRYAIDLRSMTQGRGSFTLNLTITKKYLPKLQRKSLKKPTKSSDETHLPVFR